MFTVKQMRKAEEGREKVRRKKMSRRVTTTSHATPVMGCCCCKKKIKDPVTALQKRPLIEVHITEPLIQCHSLRQVHRCYHHKPTDPCNRSSATSVLSSRFQNLDHLFIALHDYVPQEDGDLKLARGDLVELLDDTSNWWVVKTMTKNEGVVPSNYLAHVYIRPWFFGQMSRLESEHELLARRREEGNFLMRESETRSNVLSLSLRNDDIPGPIIRHYLIHCTTDGTFFIHPETSFPSLDELVIFYSKQKHILCCQLKLADDPIAN